MRTTAFINKVLRACPSVPRTVVIDEINGAMNTIFDRPLAIMRVYDESTGYDPVLSTVSGTLHYDSDDIATTENIAYIGRIYSEAGDPSSSTDINVSYALRTLHGSPISINFQEDPGSTDYYVEVYKRPTEIITETNPLEIPFSDEFIDKYLLELVVGNIEMKAHGKSVRLERFESDGLVSLYGKLNEGSNQITYTRNRYY